MSKLAVRRGLAQMIAAQVNFTGRIVWDKTKPNGQPRRCFDVTRANHLFGFEAAYDLDEGIRRTVAWYEKNRHSLSGLRFAGDQ